MTRTWNKHGAPSYQGYLTDAELAELDDYALCGIKPFASLPEGADRTNLTPMPFPRKKRTKRLEPF